jgi:addiction module RelE/StbE family toxin
MKVNWTDAARAQLRDIHAYLKQSSPRYAQQVVDRLTRRSQQLVAFPHSGRIVPDTNDVNIRELIDGQYRIIYHVIGDEIDVIAVVHTAQQWPSES